MNGELTDWQVKKFRALFDLFDNDGDKFIDESEFDGAMERLQVDTGWPAHSRVLSHVTARWKAFLLGLFAETPILTEQKWLDYLGRFLSKDRSDRSENPDHRGFLEEFSQLLFLLLDRDRNSQIDYEEFLIFFYALGQTDRLAEQCFEKLDSDGDGFLHKLEVEDLALEFFHGDKAGSRGDWFFGPPPS